MKLAYKTKNFKLTKKVKTYVQKKVIKYEKQLPTETFVEISLADVYGPKGGKDKEVHLSVEVPGEEYVHVEERTSDIYASIDAVFKKFARKIEKTKGKYLAKRRRDSVRRTIGRVRSWIPQRPTFSTPFRSKRALDISRETKHLGKQEQIDQDEAILRMKTGNENLYIYTDKSTNKVNVILRISKRRFKIWEIEND
jgi:ribosomal subunit interface protein